MILTAEAMKTMSDETFFYEAEKHFPDLLEDIDKEIFKGFDKDCVYYATHSYSFNVPNVPVYVYGEIPFDTLKVLMEYLYRKGYTVEFFATNKLCLKISKITPTESPVNDTLLDKYVECRKKVLAFLKKEMKDIEKEEDKENAKLNDTESEAFPTKDSIVQKFIKWLKK